MDPNVAHADAHYVMELEEAYENGDLLEPQLAHRLWGDERQLRGMHLHHQVNVRVIGDGIDDVRLRYFDPNFEREIIIHHIVDEDGNGVHYDLDGNPHYQVDYDRLLCPLADCPFADEYTPEELGEIKLLLSSLPADEEGHLAGASNLCPKDILLSEEGLRRCIGCFHPYYIKLMLRHGFRIDRFSREDLLELKRILESDPCLDPNSPGGEYIRIASGSAGDFRNLRNNLDEIQLDCPENFRYLPDFLDAMVRRLEEDGLDDNATASAAYIGETIRTFAERMAEEDNRNRVDGARANWEFSVAVAEDDSITNVSLMVGVVPNLSKRISWINEAIHAALHQAIFNRITGTIERMFVVGGVLLNTINCGISYFIVACTTMTLIIRWLKYQWGVNKNQIILNIANVPKGIETLIGFNWPRILKTLRKLGILWCTTMQKLRVVDMLRVLASWGGDAAGKLLKEAKAAVAAGDASTEQQQRVNVEKKRIDDIKETYSKRDSKQKQNHADACKRGFANMSDNAKHHHRSTQAAAQRTGGIATKKRKKIPGGIAYVSALPLEQL